jgi:hypothetical protein
MVSSSEDPLVSLTSRYSSCYNRCCTNFLELRKGEVHVQSPRTLAISPTTSLLCLDEFDALSFLRRAGQDGVYL